MKEGAAPLIPGRARWSGRGRVLLGAAAALVCGAGGGAAWADGSLPPLPYRYLHPPPALARNNRPPLAGHKVITARTGSSPRVQVFTRDGQVGVTAPAGALRVPAGSSLQVEIRPVESPPGLPGLYVLDGNAYTISLTTQPGNGVPEVLKPFSVDFRWPHIPTAIYVERARTWSRVCYADEGVLAGFTLSCKARTSGVYAAVAPPTTTVPIAPNTPIARSRFAWIDPYIPIIAAAALLLATTILLYFVVLPRRGRGGETGE